MYARYDTPTIQRDLHNRQQSVISLREHNVYLMCLSKLRSGFTYTGNGGGMDLEITVEIVSIVVAMECCTYQPPRNASNWLWTRCDQWRQQQQQIVITEEITPRHLRNFGLGYWRGLPRDKRRVSVRACITRLFAKPVGAVRCKSEVSESHVEWARQAWNGV